METLKCSSCGAVLNVDSDEKYIICEYCNSTNVNPHAAPKNHIEELIQNRINKAEAYIKFGNYDEALSIYKQLANDYPNDYRGHWGKVFSKTKNFTYLDISDSALNDAEFDCENALTTAPKSKKFDLANTWNSYTQKVQAYRVEDSKKKKEIEHQALKELEKYEKQEKKEKSISFILKLIPNTIIIIYNIVFIILLSTSNLDSAIVDSATPLLYVYGALTIDVLLAVLFCIFLNSKLCVYIPAISCIVVNLLFVTITSKGFCAQDNGGGFAWFIIFGGIGYALITLGCRISRWLYDNSH